MNQQHPLPPRPGSRPAAREAPPRPRSGHGPPAAPTGPAPFRHQDRGRCGPRGRR